MECDFDNNSEHIGQHDDILVGCEVRHETIDLSQQPPVYDIQTARCSPVVCHVYLTVEQHYRDDEGYTRGGEPRHRGPIVFSLLNKNSLAELEVNLCFLGVDKACSRGLVLDAIEKEFDKALKDCGCAKRKRGQPISQLLLTMSLKIVVRNQETLESILEPKYETHDNVMFNYEVERELINLNEEPPADGIPPTRRSPVACHVYFKVHQAYDEVIYGDSRECEPIRLCPGTRLCTLNELCVLDHLVVFQELSDLGVENTSHVEFVMARLKKEIDKVVEHYKVNRHLYRSSTSKRRRQGPNVQLLLKLSFDIIILNNVNDEIFDDASALEDDNEVYQTTIEQDESFILKLIPTAASAIETLEKIEVEKLDEKTKNMNCGICLDELVKEKIATRLPCDHFFHGDCVTQWLHTSHFCPLCRYEMPIDDD